MDAKKLYIYQILINHYKASQIITPNMFNRKIKPPNNFLPIDNHQI